MSVNRLRGRAGVGGKRSRCEVDRSAAPSGDIKNVTTPTLNHVPSWHVLNLIQKKNTFL